MFVEGRLFKNNVSTRVGDIIPSAGCSGKLLVLAHVLLCQYSIMTDREGRGYTVLKTICHFIKLYRLYRINREFETLNSVIILFCQLDFTLFYRRGVHFLRANRGIRKHTVKLIIVFCKCTEIKHADRFLHE